MVGCNQWKVLEIGWREEKTDLGIFSPLPLCFGAAFGAQMRCTGYYFLCALSSERFSTFLGPSMNVRRLTSVDYII
jgi:hypothetical protein